MDVKIKTYKLRFILLSLSLLLICKWANAQSNYLNQRITVSFNNISLEKVLTEISETGGFTFSYNSKNFNEDELVSLNVDNKTVQKSLNLLFNNNVEYKVVGSHVILSKKNIKETVITENKNKEYIITGFVIDSRTGEKIQEATVYEVDGQIVSNTNENGYYSLLIPSEKEVRGISYSKQGYLDTVIMVEPALNNSFDIYLQPQNVQMQKLESKYVKLEDIHQRQVVNILVPKEAKINSENLVIYNNKFAQVSFIPYIGTNRKLSGSSVNNISFNVLAGYSGGVNGIEIGGLLNIDKRDVHGAQFGGFANIVGGNSGPIQLAGFFNLNSGSVKGIQLGGFSNVVLDTLNGIQIAGFNNTLHGYMNGVQISGFNNVTTQNVDGIQLTGFANVALKDVELGQIAGFVNYCDNVDGGQIAGFSNVAKGDVNWGQICGFANYGKSVQGFQIAGFGNYSKEEVNGGQICGIINIGKTGGKYQIAGYGNIATEEIEGVQISAYFNYAKKVNGYQISIFNIADTIESGTPIGLFSFVRKGFHRFELSANEIFYVNAAYKMGVKKLYNSIRLGNNLSKKAYIGYGLGTQLDLSNKLNLNLDASYDFIFDIGPTNHIGDLFKISPNMDYRLGKHLTVFGGPSLNISNIFKQNSTFQNLAPYSIYENDLVYSQVKMWVSGVLGISFTL